MSLHRRLERLEDRVKPEPSRKSSEARAHMRAALDEIAAARREGRAPSAEAAVVAEAILRRGRQRES
jgi:hypothetical protein